MDSRPLWGFRSGILRCFCIGMTKLDQSMYGSLVCEHVVVDEGARLKAH